MLMLYESILCLVLTVTVIYIEMVRGRPVGFSYAKFSGPVSGPEKQIYIKDDHGHSHIDYIAKPDYSFSYGVDDPKTKVLQNRKETRHGDSVIGEYSVVDPDGTLRVVKYTADKVNGFQAEVITDGKSEIHGHDGHQSQHHNPHTSISYDTHQQHPVNHHQQQYANESGEDESGEESNDESREESSEDDGDY